MLALILLLTPFLGLFNSLHHGRMASLSVLDGNRTYDYSENGETISFEEAWSQFRIDDSSQFFSMPLVVGLTMLSFVFFFNINLAISAISVNLIKNKSRMLSINKSPK